MKNKFNEELASLDRHFLWSDHFRKEYHKALKNDELNTNKEPQKFFLGVAGINMCYWYASLYVVLEGIDSMQLKLDKKIRNDVDEIKGSLRLFRNVIVHHQSKYWDKRLFEIMKIEDCPQKINRVHNYLNRHLIDLMKSK